MPKIKDATIKPTFIPPERRVQIIGEINEEAYKEFSNKLYELEYDGSGTIVIELLSNGGEAVTALAFASRIRVSPCKIVVIGYGEVCSAAVLILAYGDERLMTAESWVMVHEDSMKLNGEVRELQREAGHLRRMEDQWASLLEQRTGTKASTWTKLHGDTTYLSATECLNLGLIDGVL